MNSTFSKEEIRERVDVLGPWFHNLDLKGVPTAPVHFLGDYPNVKWQRFSAIIPDNLQGKSVLDIGCNAGFYAMEMKRRGADRVVGLDTDDKYLAQARFAADVNGLKIEFRNLSAYDVGRLGEQFDLVIFMGVLYHLRHPLLALDLIHEHVARDLLLFQSMQRGDPQVDSVADDYDSGRLPSSIVRAIQSCISSNTAMLTIPRIGGPPIAPVSRPCCEAPASPLPLIPKKRSISARRRRGRKKGPFTRHGARQDD